MLIADTRLCSGFFGEELKRLENRGVPSPLLF